MTLGTISPARRGSVLVAAFLLLATAFGLVAPSAAQAAGPVRYFLTVGGTCDGRGTAYNGVDLRGGVRVQVDYPASIGYDLVCPGQTPYQQSVDIGVANLRQAVLDTHRRDPGGQLVLVGYSQGAEVVSKVLADIADGRVAVPTRQVEAKLFADPMQPGTGLGAVFPVGVGVPVINFVSPGPGRTSYNGIRFIRYCIETDGVCDNRSPFESIGGYYAQHFCYPTRFFGFIADGAYTNATQWLPRQNCRPPYPTS